MAKVYILCGKICSGKSTYSQKLRKNQKAVILSVDDITLTLLGQNGILQKNFTNPEALNTSFIISA